MLRRAAALLALLLPIAVSGRVIMIGDSMFSGGEVARDLEALANHKIENHAVGGASFHEGWEQSIPDQYAALNITEHPPPPITAIMDGGGNDVFSVKEDCDSFNDRCKQQIDEALAIAETLMNKMNDDGIAHIVFMGPFYVLGLNKAIDYGYSRLDEVCAQNKHIDCYVVDTRPVDPEKPADGDHVHPNAAGYRELANAIWAVIVDNNIPMSQAYNK